MIMPGKYLLINCEAAIGKKMSNARSLKINHEFTERSPIINPQNNKGTVTGAMTEVMITILVDSAVFPFAISVNAGEAVPAGMAVRSKIPTASSRLNG